MIPPFFPWFLAFLLLIACVALLVLLLRYRDRSVRLEAESRSWQERAEDRTQMLRRAEEVLKDSFAGISAEVLRNSEKQFLNLAETRLQSQRQQANHDLDSRKQAIESMTGLSVVEVNIHVQGVGFPEAEKREEEVRVR